MELETERLVIREFTAADEAALAAYQADPRYTEFYEPNDGGAARTRELLEMFIRWSEERPRRNFQLAVVDRASADLIGCCGVRCEGFGDGLAEFGLELAPACWGRGLATEAASAILGFAFRDLGLVTIIALSVTQNERIARVLERLGFRPARVLAGSEWMQARGYSDTEWRLDADAWRSAH
jgi:RimJ/RimL family protein N-acetyltransferase